MRLSPYFFILWCLIYGPSLLNAQSVSQFVLVNATTNQDIGVLEEGSILNLSEIGSSLNVRAEVSSSVGSIRFSWDGNNNFQTENVAPYAFAGDSNGDYNSWTPTLGEHTIAATAYSEEGATGTILSTLTIQFSVIEDEVEIDVPDNPGTGAISISGELKKWHKITLSFDGPSFSELGAGTNPFLDYRLTATFTKGNKSYLVPGYFAADGNAAESSASTGNVWRVHFAPDELGTWTYSISFRLGANIAVSTNTMAGTALAPLDGLTGTLEVEDTDKSLPDNRARGRLQYVGQSYLQYAETGEYFLKGGADAPENFLAYDDFDNTPNHGGRRKSWSPHSSDWQSGDPSWQNGKGTEIIGAVNYLASKGINVFSFLTMNIQGDDKNVFPYVNENDFLHFDCSKLDQWELVFEHADQLGMYLHFKTQETENDQLLDGGELGIARKLYYRELIARFGHHLALNWNLGEENTQTTTQRRAMAHWFKDTDPYGHHRVIHTYPGDHEEVYGDLIGDQSEYTGASIQTNWNQVHNKTKDWVLNSNASGKPWVVANDEQGNANTGVPPDPGYPGYNGSNPDLNDIRKEVLWGNLMAGGAGVEYYFGYQLPESDLSLENYRSRDQSWDYVRFALEFFRALPFSQMESSDELVSNGWCFAQTGQKYVVYLKNGGSSMLDLPDNATYTIQWYNPRNGFYDTGSISSLTGPGPVSLGEAPSDTAEDWAILVSRQLGDNIPPVAQFTTDITSGEAPLGIQFDASASTDADGSIVAYHWDFGDGNQATGQQTNHTYLTAGTFVAQLTVTDNEGAIAIQETSIVVTQPAEVPCESMISLYSRDFPYQNTNFYLDNFTGTNLLGIDPNLYQTAEVAQGFPGASCTYDITFHGVGESDGRSRFKLFINGHFLGDMLLPLSMQDWEMGFNYNSTFRNVPVNQGDEIRVYAEIGSDGEEFSRGRWLKIDFIPVEGNAGCASIWEEQNGLVVIEMENNNLIESWESTTTSGGYTGESYIQWTGNQHLNATGNGILNYPIQIFNPGTYIFDWRVGVGVGDDSTEHNDSWLKINASNFYAYRNQGNSYVKPKPACNTDPEYDCPNGSTSDGFFKNYGGPIDGWAWQSRTSDHEPHTIYAEFDAPGIYNIEVNARSSFHRIDRMVLYQSEMISQGDARQLSNPETLCTSTGSHSLQFIVGDGNQALANAQVTIGGVTYYTQADGAVSIPGMEPGTVNYLVNLDGYTSQSGQVQFLGDLTVLITLNVVTSTEDQENTANIRLYPNPVEEVLHIESSESILELWVSNSAGQVLLQPQQGKALIDVSRLPNGLYILSLRMESGEVRLRKFVKQ